MDFQLCSSRRRGRNCLWYLGSIPTLPARNPVGNSHQPSCVCDHESIGQRSRRAHYLVRNVVVRPVLPGERRRVVFLEGEGVQVAIASAFHPKRTLSVNAIEAAPLPRAS
jgi:hypothetical protein